MPQDPDLYGHRAAKKQKVANALPSSLDFSAQMTALMARPKSSDQAASRRSRAPKKTKDDIFRSGKPARRSKQDTGGDGGDDDDDDEQREMDDDSGKLVLKDVRGTDEEARERARARRNMENKARLYAAMKRGDYVAKENEAAPLVDFDRKWAENEEGKEDDYSSSSDDDDDEDDAQDRELVEYEDEFGRTRMVTKAEKERFERWERRGYLGAEELERMSARPAAPTNLIYGDAVQSMAFNPDDPEQMEALARKRDRSATPPPAQHYDADWEIRTKGTGFYKFSKDEETREREMKNLAEERQKTEAQRKGRDDEKDARKREIEKRRKEMADRRAKKQADNFLNELGA